MASGSEQSAATLLHCSTATVHCPLPTDECESSASLGGVASGKSMVARQFAALGAGVLDADRAGHEVLRLPHVEAAARRRWGEAIFGPDGRIDRARLARIVFGPGPEGGARTKIPGTVDSSGNRPVCSSGRPRPSRRRASRSRSWMPRCCWRPVGTNCAKKSCLSRRRGRCGWPGRWPAVGLRRILRPVRAFRNRWIANVRVPCRLVRCQRYRAKWWGSQ